MFADLGNRDDAVNVESDPLWWVAVPAAGQLSCTH